MQKGELGILVKAKSIWLNGVPIPKVAEAVAIAWFEVVPRGRISHMVIEHDCKTVVDAFQGESELLSNFEFLISQYREQNKPSSGADLTSIQA